jgi:hypothetical protein
MGSAQAQGLPDCAAVPGLSSRPVLTGAQQINDQTGHTYDVYTATGITWDQAYCFVADLSTTQGGSTIKPHLATITSSSENTWIVETLLKPVLPFASGKTQVWVGGFRRAPASEDFPWEWVNTEGYFPAVNTGVATQGIYANWATAQGEPNNTNNPPGEKGVTLGRYADRSVWNDEGADVGSIGGFVVEYDTPRTLTSCKAAGGCTTVEGQTLTFPAGSSGDTITFIPFERTDPRVAGGRCGIDDLKLFTAAEGFAADGSEELRIPPYLCGSPKFLVVKVNAGGLTIRNGAVAVKNDTQAILRGNAFKCSDPIKGIPGVDQDLQHQDVVVWQSTNPSRMLEGPFPVIPGVANPVGGAREGVFFGTATEATNGCGSTKGLVRTGSYFVVGMHIDFNLDGEIPSNAGPIYDQFYALTRYKLGLLLQSVRNARSSLVIRNPDGQAMESQVRNAINAMNAGDPASALTSINQFLKKVNDSTYVTTVLPLAVLQYNYNGDHLMRGENIAFTLRVKVIPFKPVP